MRRLRTDSSCSYSGRSAQRAVCVARGVELRAISKGMEAPSNPTVTVVTTGAGLRPIPKGVEIPPDPNVTRTARPVAIRGVIGQKSADGIVAKCPP